MTYEPVTTFGLNNDLKNTSHRQFKKQSLKSDILPYVQELHHMDFYNEVHLHSKIFNQFTISLK